MLRGIEAAIGRITKHGYQVVLVIAKAPANTEQKNVWYDQMINCLEASRLKYSIRIYPYLERQLEQIIMEWMDH